MDGGERKRIDFVFEKEIYGFVHVLGVQPGQYGYRSKANVVLLENPYSAHYMLERAFLALVISGGVVNELWPVDAYPYLNIVFLEKLCNLVGNQRAVCLDG